MVLGARVPLVLLAGAVATVFTCFAITPFEAVRIRMVECPAYAPGPHNGALPTPCTFHQVHC